MEEKLKALDMVLPPEFMLELREAHQAYNQSAGKTVSGEPDQLYSYGDEWNTIEADYNTEYIDIGPYTIKFSLYWWQTTCPPQYWYCFFYGFPGLEFTGDSSFTFYTITLLPYESMGESGFSG
jgi:hypothetical protein